MPLLWENLGNQLNSVRSTTNVDYSTWSTPSGAPDQGSREERLKKALAAVKATGNSQMIESLTAALEGREATMELPDLESGPQAFLKTMNQTRG